MHFQHQVNNGLEHGKFLFEVSGYHEESDFGLILVDGGLVCDVLN